MIEGQHGLLSGAFKAGDVLIAPLAGRKGSVECIIQKIVHDEDQVVAYCDDAAFIAVEGVDGVKAVVQEDSMIAETITNPEPMGKQVPRDGAIILLVLLILLQLM